MVLTPCGAEQKGGGCECHQGDDGEGPRVRQDFSDRHRLEEYALTDDEKVLRWICLCEHLQPAWHVVYRTRKTRQQNDRHDDEKSAQKRLLLSVRERRDEHSNSNQSTHVAGQRHIESEQ